MQYARWERGKLWVVFMSEKLYLSLFFFILIVFLCLYHPLFFLSTRPWDPLNDLIQFEKDGCIQTKVRHRTPMVRSGSLISLSNQGPRRDNCKCQVGCPNRKSLWSNASRRLSHLPSMHLKAPCAPPSLWLLCVVFAVLPPPSSLLLHFIVIFCLCATTFIFTFLAVCSPCDGRSCQTACCSNWIFLCSLWRDEHCSEWRSTWAVFGNIVWLQALPHVKFQNSIKKFNRKQQNSSTWTKHHCWSSDWNFYCYLALCFGLSEPSFTVLFQ